MTDNVVPLRPEAEVLVDTADTLEVEVPIYVLMQAEVLPALVGGMQVVAFQMTLKNTATSADEYLVIACASEDAKQFSKLINSVAATVKPVNKQIPQEDNRK